LRNGRDEEMCGVAVKDIQAADSNGAGLDGRTNGAGLLVAH
jgi:hypothetical protein